MDDLDRIDGKEIIKVQVEGQTKNVAKIEELIAKQKDGSGGKERY